MPRRACGTEMKSGPPSLSLFPSHTHTHTFHLFPLSNRLLTPHPLPPNIVLLVFEAQPSFMGILIVPLILLCVFIAPFVKLEALADKPITIQ